MLAELVPFWILKKNLFPASPLTSGDLLGIFSVPWHVEVSLRSLPSSSHAILSVCACLSLHFPFLIRIPVILHSAYPNYFTLTLLPVQRLYLQMSHYEILGIRIATEEFWENTVSTHNNGFYQLFLYSHCTILHFLQWNAYFSTALPRVYWQTKIFLLN